MTDERPVPTRKAVKRIGSGVIEERNPIFLGGAIVERPTVDGLARLTPVTSN
jgi:hypothetical protein